MWAIVAHAVEFSMDLSQSLAKLGLKIVCIHVTGLFIKFEQGIENTLKV